MTSGISRSRNRWLAVAGLCFLIAVFGTALAPAAPQPGASPRTARIDAAQKVYDGVRAGLSAGQATLDEVYTWSVHWLDAELAGAAKAARLAPHAPGSSERPSPRAKEKAFAAHHARMTDLRDSATKLAESGLLRAVGPVEADYYVLEAAAWQAALSR